MDQHAIDVRNLADKFQMYNDESNIIGWQPYADTLNKVKDQMNQMDQILYRLRETARVDRPWQQRVINRVAPAVFELDLYTAQAINYVNGNQDYLWNPNLREDTASLWSRARGIDQDVRQTMGASRLEAALRSGHVS